MPQSSHQPSAEGQSAVIIADADESNATHVERQLRRAGIKQPVVTFQNGDDLHAFLASAAQKDGPLPCALFLDPRMPGANGLDPVRWVRREESLKTTEVVLFSPADDPEFVESANELGIQHFLKKHPDLGSMAEVIAHLGGSEESEDSPLGEPQTVPPK